MTSSTPHSLRKFIRREKARIRRLTSDPEEAAQKVKALMARFPARRREEKGLGKESEKTYRRAGDRI